MSRGLAPWPAAGIASGIIVLAAAGPAIVDEPLMTLEAGEKALEVAAGPGPCWLAVTTFDDVGPGTGGDAGSHLGPSHVAWNGGKLGKYGHVSPGSVTFSPDCGHVAFVSVSWGKKGLGRYQVHMDGKPVGDAGLWTERLEAAGGPGPWFSPSGQRLAWIGSWKGRWHLVVDGKHQVGPGHDYILAGTPWTADGRLAIVTGDGGAETLLVEGKPRATARAIRLVRDADPPAVLAWIESGEKVDRFLVEGDEVASWPAVRAAVLAPGAISWALEVEDAAGARFVARDDGVEGPWQGVEHLSISADGTRIAYAALSDDGWRPVVDGVAGPACVRIEAIAHLDDGAVAFVWRSGSRRVLSVWRDGPSEVASFQEVHRLVPGPGGRLAASVLESGSARLLVDGALVGPEADLVHHCTIAFSPSGDHVAAALRVGGRDVVILDGRDAGSFDGVECPFLLDGETLSFLAWTAGSLVRVRVALAGPGA